MRVDGERIDEEKGQTGSLISWLGGAWVGMGGFKRPYVTAFSHSLGRVVLFAQESKCASEGRDCPGSSGWWMTCGWWCSW